MKLWKILPVLLLFSFAAGAKSLPDDPTTEKLPALNAAVATVWPVPDYTPDQAAAVLKKYSAVDPKGQVPKNILNKTLLYFEYNNDKITNKNFVGIVDYSKPSITPRLYIVGIKDGSVVVLRTAHGKGSDPKNTGMATVFSNTPGSLMTSLGFYLTGGTLNHNGTARFLDGISSTDSNARPRAILLHSASYVVDSNVRPGRSWGCIVVSTAKRDWTMKTLSQGSLIYGGLSAKD